MRTLRRSSLFALAALLAVSGLACSRVAETKSSSNTGTVRFNLTSDPATLDPLFAHADANAVEAQLARLAFEPFVDIDEHGQPIPILLESIPTKTNGGISTDGLTITYHLRHGVHWHDGPEVTAHDVLFTLDAIRDDRNPIRSRAGYDRIAKATSPDPFTAIVRLKAPWAPAVATIFSYGTAPQYVLPAHVLEKEPDLSKSAFGSHPIGNGPFRFVAWRRGESVTYEANPSYWRGAPRIARIDARIVSDPGTNLTLLRTGEIDWNLIAPIQQKTLAGRTDLHYRYVPLAVVFGITINTTHPPLDDVRVRRALAASIDRAGISTKITYGRYPVIDTAQPLSSWARDPAVKLPAYDPRAADALLDAAGWPRGSDGMRAKNGKPLAVSYVQFPESTTGVRAATVIQAELKLRGIAMAIRSVPNAQLFLPKSQGGTLATGEYDLAYVPWPMGADPDDSFMFACDGASNYMRYCNRTVDALEKRAVTVTSQEERKAIYAKIERIVVSDVPVVYLFNPSYIYAYRDGLGGFWPNAFSPTWNAVDWTRQP